MKPDRAELDRLERERKEFASCVRGDHPDEQSFRRYVLAELRCARLRALLSANEIAAIVLALEIGAIDGETAMERMAEAQTLGFLGEGAGEGQGQGDCQDGPMGAAKSGLPGAEIVPGS